MTNALFGSARAAMPLDMLRGSVNEAAIGDVLKDLFPEGQVRDFLSPPDEIAEIAYALSRSVQGAKFIEWILDGTLRAPYRTTGATIEQTALNAARREGLNIPAEMILAAISRGDKVIAARASGARQ